MQLFEITYLKISEMEGLSFNIDTDAEYCKVCNTLNDIWKLHG